MRPSQSLAVFPAFLGASVSIAIATVFGTAIFNATTWLSSGAGTTFAQASDAVSRSVVFVLLGLTNTIIGGMLGGYVAAKLGDRRPYFSAFLAALFAMTGYAIMFFSPLAAGPFEVTAVLSSFVFPVPLALLGAYVFARARNDG
jgi:hypothetical protein